jgi:large subunit ribosomal protein L25
MATETLSATPRTDVGKGAARSLRREGRVPGVIYGSERESLPLSLNSRELERLLGRISAESTVIDLDLGGSTARTLIREVQRHPFRREVIHVDFQELVAGEKVTVNIPITLVGVPEGVRLSGALLGQVMSELTIRVDPVDIPRNVEVDVSGLTIGHSVHVSDLKLPDGVEVLDEADATVATVSAPKVTEEAPVVAAETGAEPELIRKTKADEEAEK